MLLTESMRSAILLRMINVGYMHFCIEIGGLSTNPNICMLLTYQYYRYCYQAYYHCGKQSNCIKLNKTQQNPFSCYHFFYKKRSRFHMGILCQGPYQIINDLSIHKEPNAIAGLLESETLLTLLESGARASCIIKSCAYVYIVDPNLISHYLTLQTFIQIIVYSCRFFFLLSGGHMLLHCYWWTTCT